MPFGPDEITAYGAALAAIASAAGFGVAKLQGRSQTSGDICADTCVALDRVSVKIDAISRKIDQLGLAIRGLESEIDALKADIDQAVKPELNRLHERVAGLESRALPIQPKGPI